MDTFADGTVFDLDLPSPFWCRRGLACGGRVKAPWMAHLVSPRQDVALRRPGWSMLVHGLPAGRHQRGVFLWFLSLDKQRKEFIRDKHGLGSVQAWNGRNNATALERVVGLFARLNGSTPLQIALATGE